MIEMPNITLRQRYQGCLLGGAIGDALGAAVEFDSLARIQQRFGPDGIQHYEKAYGGLGRITDDTQMTLFTAEGLLRATVRGWQRGMGLFTPVVAHAYYRWLKTQGMDNPLLAARPGLKADGWLFTHSELHSQRAPGNTCLQALQEMNKLGDPAQNHSKGCGGVMRAAPMGLYQHTRHGDEALDLTFELGKDIAALTHGHPTGSLTAGVFAVLIQLLAAGHSLPDALAQAMAELTQHPYDKETLNALTQAMAAAENGTPSAETIETLGAGWIAEEALAIGVYVALVSNDFSEAMRLAVNHSGDSDSTGAIAGNLIGSMVGLDGIDESWLSPLELRPVIEQMANDLLEFIHWPVGEGSQTDEDAAWAVQIEQKYPGY